MTVAAKWTRSRIALFALQTAPTADGGWTDTKSGGRLAVACASSHRSQNPNPKINRQRLRHARRPPLPGRQCESHLGRLGYPLRFNQTGFCYKETNFMITDYKS
jgi:hypothetical protein